MTAVERPIDPKTEFPEPPKGAARFYNRELSWLQFNRRVLEEAMNRRHPLLERLRFLSISASNLDEFYMVRAAGLYGQVAAGVATLSVDGLTPKQQLEQINQFARELVAEKQACWRRLRAELAEAGIHIVEPKDLRPHEKVWLDDEFMNRLFPILTPMNVDPAHPFPFIQNQALTLAVKMLHQDGKVMKGLIPIPSQLDRFIRLPADPDDPKAIRFMRIENVIGLYLDELYPSFTIAGQGAFRVLRDSDIEFQEEAEDLTRAFETQLKRRRRGNVIRLEIDAEMPEELRQFVVRELEVSKEAIFVKEGLLGLADTAQLIIVDRPDLLFKPFNIRFPDRIREFNGDVFCRHTREGFRGPSSLRILRCGAAISPPGRR
jgi:Polyphosphate kinase